MARGRDPDGEKLYKDFVKAVYEAEGRGAKHNLELIQKAAEEGSWQASAWILERRHRYLRTDRQEHSGRVDLVAHRGADLSRLTADELETYQELLAKVAQPKAIDVESDPDDR